MAASELDMCLIALFLSIELFSNIRFSYVVIYEYTFLEVDGEYMGDKEHNFQLGSGNLVIFWKSQRRNSGMMSNR